MYPVCLLVVCFLGNIIRGTATCSMEDEVCEFWLEVNHRLTMMNDSVAVFPANGMLYLYNVTNTTLAQPINETFVVTADGWEKTRLVVTVNNTMPGPPIEVYEDQTVIVHVKNLMSTTAVTVHFHGIHQRGTPYMDGVAFVSQCPILSGQSFTHKFQAHPKGTHWYHSHIGSQLSMGLIGPLIVREKKPQPTEEFIMMLQDWNHDYDSDIIHQKMLYGSYENRVKLMPTGSLEGGAFSMFHFHSGLINGRGRHYYPNGTNNDAPLTVYTVRQSKSYRFRVTGAGNLYPFRVSVDDHPIRMLTADGDNFQPVVVESFIISPGERYDFELTANQSVNNYWIRAETLEVNVINHVAEAILRYEGAPVKSPVTARKNCTSNDRCLVLNCPFTYYPEDTFTDCMQTDDLRSVEMASVPGTDKNHPEEIREVFLNFAFPGTTWTPAAVNGRSFLAPTVSALTQPQEVNAVCDPEKCGEDKVCRCTYSVDLEYNKVYQMVLLNMGAGKGWAHPIHMHGHSFVVLKMGFPQYNNVTGKFTEENLDIECGGNPDRSKSFCNSARWANSSWGGNNIPGLELGYPIKRDTVVVPTGGYVVVRIRANNPGVWFMHCHIELHNSDGMALMLNSSFSRHPPAPAGFPRCGSFTLDGKSPAPTHQDCVTKIAIGSVVGFLSCVILTLFIILIYYKCCKKKTYLSDQSQEGSQLNLTNSRH